MNPEDAVENVLVNATNIDNFNQTIIDSGNDRTAELGANDQRKTDVEDLITTLELRSVWLENQLPEPQFQDDRLAQASEALRAHRFVILRCSCQSLAAEMTLRLQILLDKNVQARSVTFYGDASYEESIDLFSITDGLEKTPSALMFVDLATLSTRHLRRVVDQLELQASTDRVRGITQRLQNQDQWVIFYLSNDYNSGVSGRPYTGAVSLGFSEELNVLSNIWSEITDKPTSDEICSQFHGPAGHLWGASNDDRLKKLEAAIKAESLAREYQSIQDKSDTWEAEEKESYRNVLNELLFGSDLGKGDVCSHSSANAVQTVARYMLAVITQLEELSTLDFRELILELLDGLNGEIEIDASKETTTIRYAEDGVTQVEKIHAHSEPSKKTISLTDVLNQYQDLIIARFRMRLENGKLVFITEAHALVAKDCVEESLAIFSNNLIYRAIANSPLLFQVSDTVALQLCKIFAEHLADFTHNEKANKLYEFYLQFLLYSETSNSGDRNCDITRAIQNAIRMAAGQDSAAAKLKADFYYRFGCLLESISELERSGETVHAFISQVLKRNVGTNSDLTYEIVLHIVRNLREVTSVDTMYWLKIVLSSGRQSHWEQSCHEISVRIAQENTANKQSGGSSLLQLASWLPDSATSVGSYNNHSAVLFIPRLVCLRALQRVKKGSFGEVSDIPPFFDLANEDGLFHDAHVAIDLLCRPIVSNQMEELDFKLTWNLLQARWGLRSEEGRFDIGILEPNFDNYANHSDKLRLFMLLIVVIEAVNVFVSNAEPNKEKRWAVVRKLAKMMASKMINEDRCTAANLSDQFDRNLCRHNRSLHRRRIEISRFLSDVFFAAYLDKSSTT